MLNTCHLEYISSFACARSIQMHLYPCEWVGGWMGGWVGVRVLCVCVCVRARVCAHECLCVSHPKTQNLKER